MIEILELKIYTLKIYIMVKHDVGLFNGKSLFEMSR